jgi:peptidoglycan/xylan/chitin deacetylase (PgdA/CDA1 family)
MWLEGMTPWSPYRWMSRCGIGGQLSIFIFHRVLANADAHLPDEPDAVQFERICAFLAKHFQVLPLAKAARLLKDGQLPAASACITFDDGYADNLVVAAPILKRHGLVATFFIATGYIEGGRMWNDILIEAARHAPEGRLDWSAQKAGIWQLDSTESRVRAYQGAQRLLKHLEPAERQAMCDEIAQQLNLPAHSELMMSRAQVRALRDGGMEIGGHTITHPILCKVSRDAAALEIEGGRQQLREWLGEAPEVFAYPNGVPDADYSERDVELVKRAGYQAAVSTAVGVAHSGSDIYQLPRFTPWDRQMPRFALRTALNIARGTRPQLAQASQRQRAA